MLTTLQIIGLVLQIVFVLWVIILAVWTLMKSDGALKIYAILTIPIGSVVAGVAYWLATDE